MLPKLQQSSLAQSLRRDNLASQIQCSSLLTQAKINSKASSASRTTTLTNHGRTITHPKIRTPPSETSQKNTYQKKESRILSTNPFMNSPSRDLLPSIRGTRAPEARHRVLSKKEANFKSLYLNLEPSRRDRSLHLNSEGTMTEETCLFE